VKIAVVSDLHLTNYDWGMECQDSFHSLGQVKELCLREKVSALIIAGDVFDSTNPDSYSYMDFKLFVQGLPDVDIWAIAGQHDMTDPQWYHLAGVSDLDGNTMKLGGVEIFGLGYRKPTEFPDVFDQVPDSTNVVVGHNMCSDAVPMFSGDFSLKDIQERTKAKLFLFGDYHVPWRSEDKSFYHIGAVRPRRIDDTFQPRSLILDTKRMKIKSVDIPARKVIRKFIRDEKELVDFGRGISPRVYEDTDLEPVFVISHNETLSGSRIRHILQTTIPGCIVRPSLSVIDADEAEAADTYANMTEDQALNEAYEREGVEDDTTKVLVRMIQGGEDIRPVLQGLVDSAESGEEFKAPELASVEDENEEELESNLGEAIDADYEEDEDEDENDEDEEEDEFESFDDEESW